VGETTLAFLQRHLRRFGLMIWDGPDGRVVVAEPDDDQDSIYEFRCFRDEAGQGNNVTRIARIEDVSGVPTSLSVFGYSGGLDYQRSKVSTLVTNQALIESGFALGGEAVVGFRPMVIVDDGVRTAELARRTANREFSERARRSDVIAVETDRYADADDGAVYAIDTCCEAYVETLGGAAGKYYIEEVTYQLSVDAARRCAISASKAGSWVL
jgi:prophage tail gpP-like protein